MDNRAIGVFDSGLGGLTAVRRLQEIMPQERIIYFGAVSYTHLDVYKRQTTCRLPWTS